MDIIEIAREVIEKAEKATPRPWEVDPDWREDGADQIIELANALTICFMATPIERHEADGEYIVASANHAPELARAVLEQREEMAQKDQKIERLTQAHGVVNIERIRLTVANAALRRESHDEERKVWANMILADPLVRDERNKYSDGEFSADDAASLCANMAFELAALRRAAEMAKRISPYFDDFSWRGELGFGELVDELRAALAELDKVLK